VPEADPEHRNLACEVFDGIRGDTIVFEGFTWTWRDDEVRRVHRDELIHRNLVITEHLNVRAKFTEVLDKVIGKGVVVID